MFAKNRNGNVRPYLRSLAACLNRMAGQGYDQTFRATKEGLMCETNHQTYGMNQVSIVSFFRFAGNSNPRDNASIYLIETSDGLKGTLVELSHRIARLPYASMLNSVWTNKNNGH